MKYPNSNTLFRIGGMLRLKGSKYLGFITNLVLLKIKLKCGTSRILEISFFKKLKNGFVR